MKTIGVWVASNLAWMAVVYIATLLYYRFKNRPVSAIFNAIGTFLAAVAAMGACIWVQPKLTISHGTVLRYYALAYIGLTSAAIIGVAVAGVLDHFTRLDSTDTNHWIGQLFMPFNICIAVWLLLTALNSITMAVLKVMGIEW